MKKQIFDSIMTGQPINILSIGELLIHDLLSFDKSRFICKHANEYLLKPVLRYDVKIYLLLTNRSVAYNLHDHAPGCNVIEIDDSFPLYYSGPWLAENAPRWCSKMIMEVPSL